MLLKYDAWNWLNFSQNEEKWYSDNFQEPLKAYLVNIALFHKTVQKRARIKIKFHIFWFFSTW